MKLDPDWLDVEMREVERDFAVAPEWLRENVAELQRQIDRDIRLARARDRAMR